SGCDGARRGRHRRRPDGPIPSRAARAPPAQPGPSRRPGRSPPDALRLVGARVCRGALRRVGAAAARRRAVIDEYLTYLRDVRRMSPNTLESYARDLALLAAFAEKRQAALETLQRQDLEAFVRQLMSSGLAPRSVARAVACVRGFYRFVTIERKQDHSPADDLHPPRAWPPLPRFLSLEEVDHLLEQPDTDTPRGLRDKALIEVLYATGLRVSELVALR